MMGLFRIFGVALACAGLGQGAAAQVSPLDLATSAEALAKRCVEARILGEALDLAGLTETRRDDNGATLADSATGAQLVLMTPADEGAPQRCVVQVSPGFMPDPPEVGEVDAYREAARARLTGYLFNTFDAGLAPTVLRCLGASLPQSARDARKQAARISDDGTRAIFAWVMTQAQITTLSVVALGPLGTCQGGE